jgi:hypothetical protein
MDNKIKDLEKMMMWPEFPMAGADPAPMTREEIIEGLREIYAEVLGLKQAADPCFRRYPDYEKILDYLEQHGLPPRRVPDTAKRWDALVTAVEDLNSSNTSIGVFVMELVSGFHNQLNQRVAFLKSLMAEADTASQRNAVATAVLTINTLAWALHDGLTQAAEKAEIEMKKKERGQ